MSSVDWKEWSREAVALMRQRNDDWQARYALGGAPFRWNTETGTIVFRDGDRPVYATIIVVGTVSRAAGTFLWAWANDFPAIALNGLGAVRDFGRAHDLPLLTRAEWPGGRAELLEMVAVSGRILDAEGCFVDELGDVTIGFALRNFREGR